MMDDLLTAVVSKLHVDTAIPNNPAAPHPRFSGIKSRKPSDQAKRRAYLLVEQKRRRAEIFDSSRDLAQTSSIEDHPAQKRTWHTATNSEPEDNETESAVQTKVYGKKLCLEQELPKSTFRHQRKLMLSEWLVDVPEDLKEAWYMVPCPEGKRSCVSSIFHKGRITTKAVTRHGHSLLDCFRSNLPKATTLDCIWSAANSTFYVIDVLEWNGMSVVECETEFRFNWLLGKFREMGDVFVRSPENLFAFTLLPFYACTVAIMSDAMSCYPMFPDGVPRLDGLLFYHTATHYYAGPTPLVGWLKPHMMTEVLGVSVAQEFNSHCLHVQQKKRPAKGSRSAKPSSTKYSVETMETNKHVPVTENSESMEKTSDLLVENMNAIEDSKTECDVTTCD